MCPPKTTPAKFFQHTTSSPSRQDKKLAPTAKPAKKTYKILAIPDRMYYLTEIESVPQWLNALNVTLVKERS